MTEEEYTSVVEKMRLPVRTESTRCCMAPPL